MVQPRVHVNVRFTTHPYGAVGSFSKGWPLLTKGIQLLNNPSLSAVFDLSLTAGAWTWAFPL